MSVHRIASVLHARSDAAVKIAVRDAPVPCVLGNVQVTDAVLGVLVTGADNFVPVTTVLQIVRRSG